MMRRSLTTATPTATNRRILINRKLVTNSSSSSSSASGSPKQKLGEKVTVACKKGCVFLQDVGSAPFALVETKRGSAIVTHGYRAVAYSDGEYWIGETRIVQDDTSNDWKKNKVLYRFTSQRDKNIASEWRTTPTEAYKECNDRLHTGFKGAGNGQLIIGVTYPTLQQKIASKFPEVQEIVNSSTSARDQRKRSRNALPRAPVTPRRKRIYSEDTDGASDFYSSQSCSESEQTMENDGSSCSSGQEDEKEEDDAMMQLSNCFTVKQSISDDNITFPSTGIAISTADQSTVSPPKQLSQNDMLQQEFGIVNSQPLAAEDLFDFLDGLMEAN
jgi:hypothetical protein